MDDARNDDARNDDARIDRDRAGSLSRRGLIASAAALTVTPELAHAAPAHAWTRAAYEAAMHASGRPTRISEAAFDAIQKRKGPAIERIHTYLNQRFGAADPRVVQAFREVPREYYHYNYAVGHGKAGMLGEARPEDAYETNPKPWAIGYGSALSDYLGQAYMTQLCKPGPNDVTLEVGTGSGFQSSLLSRMVKHAYSIEIIQPLGHAVGKIFAPLGYSNISTRVGDGYYGWPEVKGGFDIIIVTCAARYAPPVLFSQLKPGGRMIIPIGQPFKRGQILYVYTKDAQGKVHSRRDVGVFFIPMTGAISKTGAPAAGH
ncbi:MAG TPA: protein-L-isoaspartate O-methyltransferase [Caulobacteraceae bacterium]|jgi:protein-L-isoaspartate(D-aspartate) O-methyltransferase|nr:protein-L-isoaspartate O-methyltransferase [Caulobacteraceae bacterium]